MPVSTDPEIATNFDPKKKRTKIRQTAVKLFFQKANFAIFQFIYGIVTHPIKFTWAFVVAVWKDIAWVLQLAWVIIAAIWYVFIIIGIAVFVWTISGSIFVPVEMTIANTAVTLEVAALNVKAILFELTQDFAPYFINLVADAVEVFSDLFLQRYDNLLPSLFEFFGQVITFIYQFLLGVGETIQITLELYARILKNLVCSIVLMIRPSDTICASSYSGVFDRHAEYLVGSLYDTFLIFVNIIFWLIDLLFQIILPYLLMTIRALIALSVTLVQILAAFLGVVLTYFANLIVSLIAVVFGANDSGGILPTNTTSVSVTNYISRKIDAYDFTPIFTFDATVLIAGNESSTVPGMTGYQAWWNVTISGIRKMVKWVFSNFLVLITFIDTKWCEFLKINECASELFLCEILFAPGSLIETILTTHNWLTDIFEGLFIFWDAWIMLNLAANVDFVLWPITIPLSVAFGVLSRLYIDNVNVVDPTYPRGTGFASLAQIYPQYSGAFFVNAAKFLCKAMAAQPGNCPCTIYKPDPNKAADDMLFQFGGGTGALEAALSLVNGVVCWLPAQVCLAGGNSTVYDSNCYTVSASGYTSIQYAIFAITINLEAMLALKPDHCLFYGGMFDWIAYQNQFLQSYYDPYFGNYPFNNTFPMLTFVGNMLQTSLQTGQANYFINETDYLIGGMNGDDNNKIYPHKMATLSHAYYPTLSINKMTRNWGLKYYLTTNLKPIYWADYSTAPLQSESLEFLDDLNSLPLEKYSRIMPADSGSIISVLPGICYATYLAEDPNLFSVFTGVIVVGTTSNREGRGYCPDSRIIYSKPVKSKPEAACRIVSTWLDAVRNWYWTFVLLNILPGSANWNNVDYSTILNPAATTSSVKPQWTRLDARFILGSIKAGKIDELCNTHLLSGLATWDAGTPAECMAAFGGIANITQIVGSYQRTYLAPQFYALRDNFISAWYELFFQDSLVGLNIGNSKLNKNPYVAQMKSYMSTMWKSSNNNFQYFLDQMFVSGLAPGDKLYNFQEMFYTDPSAVTVDALTSEFIKNSPDELFPFSREALPCTPSVYSESPLYEYPHIFTAHYQTVEFLMFHRLFLGQLMLDLWSSKFITPGSGCGSVMGRADLLDCRTTDFYKTAGLDSLRYTNLYAGLRLGFNFLEIMVQNFKSEYLGKGGIAGEYFFLTQVVSELRQNSTADYKLAVSSLLKKTKTYMSTTTDLNAVWNGYLDATKDGIAANLKTACYAAGLNPFYCNIYTRVDMLATYINPVLTSMKTVVDTWYARYFNFGDGLKQRSKLQTFVYAR